MLLQIGGLREGGGVYDGPCWAMWGHLHREHLIKSLWLLWDDWFSVVWFCYVVWCILNKGINNGSKLFSIEWEWYLLKLTHLIFFKGLGRHFFCLEHVHLAVYRVYHKAYTHTKGYATDPQTKQLNWTEQLYYGINPESAKKTSAVPNIYGQVSWRNEGHSCFFSLNAM